MNYLGGKEIKNYYLGASTIKTIHVGDIMVYPEDVYTYTVTDFALVYSSNTYLLSNASNYAYVTAKYNTYVNGKLTKTDIVICKPNTITDAKVIIDSDNHIKWNKEQYGTTVFPYITTAKFTASYNGVTSDYFTVKIGSNTIVIADVSVDTLKINNSTAPFLLATEAYYTIEVSGTKRETSAVGAGRFENFNTAADHCVRLCHSYTPNRTERIEKKYRRFCALYEAGLQIANME